MDFSCFDGFQQVPRVAKTAYNSAVHVGTAQGVGPFPEGRTGADVGKQVRIGIFSCDFIIGCPQGCFHDAACHTEDGASPCMGSHGIIEGFFLEQVGIDAIRVQHTDKFPCRKDAVHVLTMLGPHRGKVAFCFLARQGMMETRKSFSGSVPSFLQARSCDGAKHLLRGLGG